MGVIDDEYQVQNLKRGKKKKEFKKRVCWVRMKHFKIVLTLINFLKDVRMTKSSLVLYILL